jgi:formate/nitrite transporter FocA (FNT family)
MPHTPPKKILEQICTVAKDKTEQSWERILVLGFFAGSYISLGCLMAIMVGGGMPSIQEENPGLQRLVFGAVFTFGLMLCVISGSEVIMILNQPFFAFTSCPYVTNILTTVKIVVHCQHYLYFAEFD